MKKVLCLGVFLMSGLTFADFYEIDPSHTRVGFEVDHLMISSIDGNFKDFAGSFEYLMDKNTIKDLKVKVKANSISTNQEKRDEHLKSADFFDVKKYPEMVFVSREIKLNKKGKGSIKGDLTLHGQTLPVTLDAVVKGPIKNPWGVTVLAFEGHSKINRKEFGLTWNKALETGGVVVGEIVKISIKGEANLQNKKIN